MFSTMISKAKFNQNKLKIKVYKIYLLAINFKNKTV